METKANQIFHAGYIFRNDDFVEYLNQKHGEQNHYELSKIRDSLLRQNYTPSELDRIFNTLIFNNTITKQEIDEIIESEKEIKLWNLYLTSKRKIHMGSHSPRKSHKKSSKHYIPDIISIQKD